MGVFANIFFYIIMLFVSLLESFHVFHTEDQSVRRLKDCLFAQLM